MPCLQAALTCTNWQQPPKAINAPHKSGRTGWAPAPLLVVAAENSEVLKRRQHRSDHSVSGCDSVSFQLSFCRNRMEFSSHDLLMISDLKPLVPFSLMENHMWFSAFHLWLLNKVQFLGSVPENSDFLCFLTIHLTKSEAMQKSLILGSHSS